MIEITYTQFSEAFPPDFMEKCLEAMPFGMRQEINRFRRWQDRQARLLGRLLLLELLEKFGLGRDVLKNMSYTEFGRPYLNGGIDFNTSHSGEYIVCCATDKGRVGIDVEEIRPVDLRDFRNSLTPEEWGAIQQSKIPLDAFFDCWTMKESIMKADGKGLSIPLLDIHINLNETRATLLQDTWFLTKISLFPGYKCCLATDSENADLLFRQVTF